jgi:hypothetical protein
LARSLRVDHWESAVDTLVRWRADDRPVGGESALGRRVGARRKAPRAQPAFGDRLTDIGAVDASAEDELLPFVPLQAPHLDGDLGSLGRECADRRSHHDAGAKADIDAARRALDMGL